MEWCALALTAAGRSPLVAIHAPATLNERPFHGLTRDAPAYPLALASATASGPAGKRRVPDASFAARQTPSAPSDGLVTAAGWANAPRTPWAKAAYGSGIMSSMRKLVLLAKRVLGQ